MATFKVYKPETYYTAFEVEAKSLEEAYHLIAHLGEGEADSTDKQHYGDAEPFEYPYLTSLNTTEPEENRELLIAKADCKFCKQSKRKHKEPVPTMNELWGSMPNLTGGKSIQEYLADSWGE